VSDSGLRRVQGCLPTSLVLPRGCLTCLKHWQGFNSSEGAEE
jgi:hypothetical protein